MHSQTETTIDEFLWRGQLWRLKLTAYFHQTEYHPPSRTQDASGGHVFLTRVEVDYALMGEDGEDREACPCERREIERAVRKNAAALDWIYREIEASV